MRVVKSRPATKDIIESATYLLTHSKSAAIRFIDAVEDSIRSLAENPKIGKQISDDGLRMWFVKGFDKQLVIYRFTNDEIRIVRVIHSSMDYKKILPD